MPDEGRLRTSVTKERDEAPRDLSATNEVRRDKREKNARVCTLTRLLSSKNTPTSPFLVRTDMAMLVASTKEKDVLEAIGTFVSLNGRLGEPEGKRGSGDGKSEAAPKPNQPMMLGVYLLFPGGRRCCACPSSSSLDPVSSHRVAVFPPVTLNICATCALSRLQTLTRFWPSWSQARTMPPFPRAATLHWTLAKTPCCCAMLLHGCVPSGLPKPRRGLQRQRRLLRLTRHLWRSRCSSQARFFESLSTWTAS